MKPLFRSRIVYALVILAVLGCGEVRGADRKVTGSTDLYIFSYDPGSAMRIPKGVLRIRVGFLLTEKGKKKIVEEYGRQYEDVDQALSSIEFDCVARKRRFLETRFYSGDRLVSISDNPEVPWESVRPETVEETVYKGICK